MIISADTWFGKSEREKVMNKIILKIKINEKNVLPEGSFTLPDTVTAKCQLGFYISKQNVIN